MGGSPNPPMGKLGDFEKRLYIYYRNKALFVNWSLQNTTARPAKVRIWMSIVHRFKLVKDQSKITNYLLFLKL